MNWRKNQSSKVVALIWAAAFIGGCGVKGDPLPPEKPAELGRGRPTYKRATEEIKIEKRAKRPPLPQDDKEDSDDEDKD